MKIQNDAFGAGTAARVVIRVTSVGTGATTV